MFNDFVLKIESELSRRNRLRIEVYEKFDHMEKHLDKMQKEIDRFDDN